MELKLNTRVMNALHKAEALGPCAKQRVRCKITCLDGGVVTGENYCLTPQTKCPREPGEGYEKCKSICNQLGHAEQVAACYADTYKMGGASAELSGHTYFCMDCQHALFKVGVKWLSIKQGDKL